MGTTFWMLKSYQKMASEQQRQRGRCNCEIASRLRCGLLIRLSWNVGGGGKHEFSALSMTRYKAVVLLVFTTCSIMCIVLVVSMRYGKLVYWLSPLSPCILASS